MIDHNNVHCEDATAIVFFFGEQVLACHALTYQESCLHVTHSHIEIFVWEGLSVGCPASPFHRPYTQHTHTRAHTQGMRDTRAKGTKQGRRMTFQSQSKMHKIDVPSDLVSSNFEMWMQQEEARVLVSPKPQSCMFNTETMMCQPPSVLIMLCTRLTSQVGRLTICSHVHVCLYLGSQAAQHMKELYKEIFMEDDAPSASASSTAIPSSGRVVRERVGAHAHAPAHTASSWAQKACSENVKEDVCLLACSHVCLLVGSQASSATGRRLGMAPTHPTSPPMNPISHRGNHAKSPPAGTVRETGDRWGAGERKGE